jgi:alcohol dehydrogenase, propanol-preferring
LFSTRPERNSGAPTFPCPKRLRVRYASRWVACAVCRTDLHVVDGELPGPKLPLIPGHQVVGRVVEGGERFEPGKRIGIPWLG